MMNFLIRDGFAGSPGPSPVEIAAASEEANEYLFDLSQRFDEIGFDLYALLGQRNLSGFVGEVFARFAASRLQGYRANPHPDGRPDLVDVSSSERLKFLTDVCFSNPTAGGGPRYPLREHLAPFKFGGIEVKATIGKMKGRASSFAVGQSRADAVTALTFWGHHTSCRSMLGVYYDYFPFRNASPQIAAIFFLELVEADWNPVSIGKPGSKKTSNTSLSSSGQSKLRKGLLTYLDSVPHVEALKRASVVLP
jgi:hypothetical protein